MIRVELSVAADADLTAILDYSLTLFGDRVAEAYYLDLKAAFARLCDFPELGTVRDDLTTSPRCLRCREHLIFYRFDGTTVFVGRILHKRMDPSHRMM